MKFILGGGITGLITSLYFKTFSILTKGKGQDSEYLGLKVLRKTEAADEFVSKFIINNRNSNRKIKSRVFKVGFFINNKLVTKLNKDLKQEYLEKVNDWKVADDLTDIEGYDMIDIYRELVNRFDIKTRRIFVSIKKINNKNRIISGINPIHKQVKIVLLYNQLINTLPIVLFNSLVEGEFIKIVDSQMYICVLESSELASKMKDIDFVYFPDKKVPYYRITKTADKRFCVESKQVFLPKTDFDFSCKVIKTVQLPFGRMVSKTKPIEIDNVVHLGRNAMLDQTFTIDKLIYMLENKEVRI